MSSSESLPSVKSVQSDFSTKEVTGDDTQSTPLDGGYGWVCVVAQFFLNAFTWGVAASYSVYLAYYLSHNLFPEARPLDYAFIGGFNYSFALLVAPAATLMSRLYGVHAPMFLGVVLLPIGLIAASFATKVWHLYLSQGLCAGTGIGLICIPSIAILPQWFSKKISLANGICSAGAGIGGLIICFSTKGMLDSLGLAWSLRITAAVAFSVNLTAMLLIRSRDNQILLPAQGIFNFHLRSYHVLLLLGWSFVIMFGFITLMFSLSNYASTIGSSERDAAMVPAMLNLGAAIGRPVIGFASDYYGRVEVAGILTFTCGVLVFVLWIPTTTYGMLLLFAVVGGTILGIFWAVICPLATEVVGLKKLPAFLPIAWLSVVIPSAAAEVIALSLRRPELGARGYLYTQIFAGTSYIVASLFLLELWRSRRKASLSSGSMLQL